MKYTGTKSEECTITIHNVTEEFNCTWAGRLDEDLTNRELTMRNSGLFYDYYKGIPLAGRLSPHFRKKKMLHSTVSHCQTI